jgi:hypothetical protein
MDGDCAIGIRAWLSASCGQTATQWPHSRQAASPSEMISGKPFSGNRIMAAGQSSTQNPSLLHLLASIINNAIVKFLLLLPVYLENK